MDGSNVETLITSSEYVGGLTLDVAGGQIYWTSIESEGFSEEGIIYRANLDGSNVETLIDEQNLPFFLALDVAGGQIYWTAFTAIDPEGVPEESIIYRANLDGSNVETLITSSEPVGSLTLDVAGDQIYWTAIDPEGEEGSIYRANLDGSNVETLITGLEPAAAVIVLGP